eukprot:scaffold59348_cov69-Phaeocystis_antarctica.AAC.1
MQTNAIPASAPGDPAPTSEEPAPIKMTNQQHYKLDQATPVRTAATTHSPLSRVQHEELRPDPCCTPNLLCATCPAQAPPALHAPALHDHAARPRAPRTHATSSPSTYVPRDLVRCLCCLAVLVVRGGREARPEQAASREACPEPAGPLSLTEVPSYTSLFPGVLLGTSHRMWSAPQVTRPRLIKWLAAFCVLECVGAATSPSSPAPKFGAATSYGGDGSGSGEGLPPVSTCGCSDELEGAAVLHAAELEGVRGEFEGKLGEIEVKLEGIRQFLSMTPPTSPPSPPPPPSSPQVRDCAASPCTDGYWLNGIGADCAVVRDWLSGGA